MTHNTSIWTPACKVDYNYLLSTLHDFSVKYPFIGVTYMGTSVLGRGIPMVTLGEGGRRSKAVLYVGAHHGMEWLTCAALLRFISDYCEAYLDRRRMFSLNIPYLFKARTVHIIPCLNVDGVDLQINGAGDCVLRDRLISMNGGEDFTHWQANARGVDLNHNYDAGFYEYKKLEGDMGIDGGCATRFSGEAPESEPEVASLCSLLRFSEEITAVFTFHTQGEEIYYKGGGNSVPRSASIARLLSRMTGYKLSDPEGPAAYGGLTDWVIRELRRPSFTIECGKGENPLPMSELDGIYERLRETLFTAPVLA